ncbi:MBL fold metallo-hydrolase [Sunxiuqinia dokdonensis]|nr:MBL fold metallo-hydrolase [Sunxiuqinia dokdonensis]
MGKIIMILLTILIALAVLVVLIVRLNPSFGASPTGERMQRIQQSPNFKDGKFQNPVATAMQTEDMPFLRVMKEFLFTKGDRVPTTTIQTMPVDRAAFHQQTDGVKICWLGHSTVLIEMDGQVILTDPVFSQRVSPFSFVGTKAFPYSENYHWENLPKIDLVLLSHDHYDHLDYKTIRSLKDQDLPFVTALGVGAHLERWGIAPERITELDWWESFQFTENIRLTATPARHFSGRGLTNRFSTLWASWVITGPENRVFFGADSGYYPGFKTIGEQYGPFDLVMLECGQYSQYWPYIHMLPEEVIRAANDLGAQSLLPIHWGKYKLSIHPWTEPIERLLQAGNNRNLAIGTPQIGEVFDLDKSLPTPEWWKE